MIGVDCKKVGLRLAVGFAVGLILELLLGGGGAGAVSFDMIML